ncbi:MAG: DUF5131 family protein [Chthoniobacterales bacterium]
MSIKTNIQWCDSTVNPMMACDGCELWPTILQLVNNIAEVAKISDQKNLIKGQLAGLLPSDVYHRRAEFARMFTQSPDPHEIAVSEKAIKDSFRCYAGQLHLFRGEDDTKPLKKTNPGYARKFEEPKLFPGRTAAAAAWRDLGGEERPDSPWKKTLPRLIFISDMGDALSKDVPFEYLHTEIIKVASSGKGQRHIWLWLTKRPRRMAEFSDWLIERDISWPDNLVAMTSVTSAETAGRVEQLRKVRCKFRALSVEPLWTPVNLPLEGIDWAIVGGESGSGAKPFQLDWARDIIGQCRTAGVAPFVKQLGAAPFEGDRPLNLRDSHGGDWEEWPTDVRVREFPPFKLIGALVKNASSHISIPSQRP